MSTAYTIHEIENCTSLEEAVQRLMDELRAAGMFTLSSTGWDRTRGSPFTGTSRPTSGWSSSTQDSIL